MMRRTVLSLASVLLPVIGCWLGGCNQRDSRSGDQRIRSPKVKTVTHYGRTLNAEATPQEVAYVLLRAMRDDFQAADAEARNAALDVQFEVCAAGAMRKSNPLSITGDEFIHGIVYHWTPTVGYYIDNFDLTWEQAKTRLIPAVAQPIEAEGTKIVTTNVLMELADPGGDVNAQVVLVIRLVQDDGYWRVLKLEFDRRRREIELHPSPPMTDKP